MKDDTVQKARRILERILYLTIATASKDGIPWNSPVFFAHDKKYNFYWKSGKDAQHSQNIKENNNVFMVLYDSTAPFGEGAGVFIQAKAYVLTGEKEIAEALSYHNARVGKELWKVDEFMGENPRRVYKAVPEKIWINKDTVRNGKFVDMREEIDLLEL